MTTLIHLLTFVFVPVLISSARPVMTFLGIQAIVAALTAYQVVVLPASYLWIIHPIAIGVMVLLAAFEWFARQDSAVAEIARDLHLETLFSFFGAMAVLLLLAALQIPVSSDIAALLHEQGANAGSLNSIAETGTLVLGDAQEVVQKAQQAQDVPSFLRDIGSMITATYSTPVVVAPDVAAAAAQPALAAVDPGAVVAATPVVVEGSSTIQTFMTHPVLMGSALMANVGMSLARKRILDGFTDIGLDETWSALEGGGILVTLLLLPFFPIILGILVILISLLSIVLAIAIHKIKSVLDSRDRHLCPNPACSYRVANRATICPQCHAPQQATEQVAVE